MDPIPSFSIRMDLTGLQNASQAVKDAAALRDSPQMEKALNEALLEIVEIAGLERFTGKGPFPFSEHRLGNISGAMKRFLYAEPAKKTADGYTSRMGSSVEYFGIHEFGFDGEVSVREHTRKAATITKPGPWRATPKGVLMSVRKKSLLMKDGKVKAHTRKLKIEARQPLRSALADHSPRIIEDTIKRVFGDEMNGKQKGLH